MHLELKLHGNKSEMYYLSSSSGIIIKNLFLFNIEGGTITLFKQSYSLNHTSFKSSF